MRFGSLFSGIGGFDLGFERAGLTCAWQVEINPFCRQVLAKHWPDLTRWDDVKTFPPEPVENWNVEVICGGDPCQRNSGATGGNQSSAESLGGEFIRIVDALRPRIVVRENPSHIRKDAPWPWFRFRSELERLGYAVLPFKLRACCFGAEHERERMFLLAVDPDTDRLGLEGREAEAEERHAGQPPRLVHAGNGIALSPPRGFGSRAGLPDYLDRIKSLGNCVVPQVAEWIGRQILAGIGSP